MNNIVDFGANWNPSEDIVSALESARQQEQKNALKSTAPKLTPAQKRDAAYVELDEAIRTKNEELVSAVLTSHPKLVVAKTTHEFEHKAFVHFHEPVVRLLMERGVAADPHILLRPSMWRNLNVVHHDALLFVLGQPQYGAWDKMDDGAKSAWGHVFGMCLRSTNPHENQQDNKNAPLSAEQHSVLTMFRNTLEKHFPPLFDAYFNNTGALKSLWGNIHSKSPQTLKNLIGRLADKDWSEVWNNLASQYTSFDVQQLEFLWEMLNKHDFLLRSWNQNQEKMRAENAQFNMFYDKYIERDAAKFSQTTLGKTLTGLRPPTARTSYSYRTQNPPQMVLQYDENVSSKNDYRRFEVYTRLLGFDMREQVKHNLAPLFRDHDFTHHTTIQNEPSPIQVLPTPVFPSFMHKIAAANAPAMYAALHSEQGRRALEECLQDENVAMCFIRNSNITQLSSVLKACPNLLEWNDAHNNTLGHYMMVVHAESTKTAAQTLLRVARPWFDKKNDQGFDLVDLFQENKAAPTTIAEIQQTLMKKALKEDTTAGQKMRARVQFNKPARRM